ncbi:PhaM family polyhydroxyalkanoate granule multifunctional regulatory protein [uncultured Ralstonia sp.]|jgi:cell division septation protein DedD|uniref:PhaM family polyhydroxyalkanoate granule multifunctional regulatory protein n=1 Tax=Ralstonia sp. TaxID=54061 RepID=UPI001EA96CE3|nr:PhaM family polyhydroxyalkanoate granule multifunctional regulatory protein [uncultured Ralstonia sp.]UCF25535.1 MAG: transcriptional regulator [Ralstonia sp.]
MFTQMPNFAEGGFDFLRKLWGGSLAGMAAGGMPSMANFAAPPMDLEELDKRIHDLRAVESWLQLNASLLRTAIQGLEVQRATLVALQTFGSALSPDAMRSAFDNLSSPGESAAAGAESKPAWPHTSTAKPAEAEAPPPEDEAEIEAEDTDDDEAEAHAQAAAQAQAAARAAAAALDPSPWWNLLQQQFNQIASSAAAAMPMPQNLMPGFPGGFPGFGGAPGAEGLDTAPEDIEGNGAPAAKPAAARRATGKPAAKAAPKPAAKPTKAPAGKTAKTAGKPATKTAAKTVAKKAPAKSTAAKPASGTP